MATLQVTGELWRDARGDVMSAVFLAGALAITGISAVSAIAAVELRLEVPGFAAEQRTSLLVSVQRDADGRETRSYRFVVADPPPPPPPGGDALQAAIDAALARAAQ